MSILFEPINLGPLIIKNRFVRSATYEAMARENGEVTDELIRLYRNLAKGQAGLIIAGFSYVHPSGKSFKHQTGIHDDAMINGWKRIVDEVHDAGGTIAIQLAHGGIQSVKEKGTRYLAGPSGGIRNYINFTTSREMSDSEIQETIESFGAAAARAISAGVDAIQVHAAHGYLGSEFLSPFFNRREDSWGGTDEKRFRFLKEIIAAIKKSMPDDKALLVKLNTDDNVKVGGITPQLARTYAGWLVELGIDGLEVSCGTAAFSPFNVIRGMAPYDDLARAFPRWSRWLVKPAMKRMIKPQPLSGEYNLEAANLIKPILGKVPLILVGGVRSLARMDRIIQDGAADMISMCRPFIREPMLVKEIMEGKLEAVACTSCSRCFAAVFNEIPLACYVRGLPMEK
ncbi:MAG TPA: NADH:flavin oxidoreductase [Candidatus Lokiarchaeia archaeon]|nr:NADH:flavin oxidoreductase [Candidatus Lokiarchaeia archaeon]